MADIPSLSPYCYEDAGVGSVGAGYFVIVMSTVYIDYCQLKHVLC